MIANILNFDKQGIFGPSITLAINANCYSESSLKDLVHHVAKKYFQLTNQVASKPSEFWAKVLKRQQKGHPLTLLEILETPFFRSLRGKEHVQLDYAIKFICSPMLKTAMHHLPGKKLTEQEKFTLELWIFNLIGSYTPGKNLRAISDLLMAIKQNDSTYLETALTEFTEADFNAFLNLIEIPLHPPTFLQDWKKLITIFHHHRSIYLKDFPLLALPLKIIGKIFLHSTTPHFNGLHTFTIINRTYRGKIKKILTYQSRFRNSSSIVAHYVELFCQFKKKSPMTLSSLINPERLEFLHYLNPKKVLHRAIKLNDISAILYLLRNHCINSILNESTALLIAIEYEFIDILKILLNHASIDPSFDLNWPICYAAKIGNRDIVKTLLADPRVDPSTEFNLPLAEACELGHLEIVKLLLDDARVNPADVFCPAIVVASEYEQWDIVKFLLNDKRVDSKSKIGGKDALYYACKYGNQEMMTLLKN